MNNLPRLASYRGKDRAYVFVATMFFLSAVPPAIADYLKRTNERAAKLIGRFTGSGLIGALFGLATYNALPYRIAASPIAILIGVGLSVWISDRAEKILGSHDDSRIVIDEWIGMWIAVWGIVPGYNFRTFTGLILFRVFDVWKGPWNRGAQKWPGGWGVTMDDVFAGFMANFFTRLTIALFP